MKYAVIRTGGKQYRVSEGDIVTIELLSRGESASDAISFSDVLFYTADGVSQVGQPTLAGVDVIGKILGEVKGQKIRVAKFKAKARHRRVSGHRQSLLKVQIETIGKGDKKTVKKLEETPKEQEKITKTKVSSAKK